MRKLQSDRPRQQRLVGMQSLRQYGGGNVIWIYILLVLIVYLLISMWRNEVALQIQTAFLDDPTLYPRAYKKLPSGNEMTFHPKHWFRCTKSQWAIYIGEWDEAK